MADARFLLMASIAGITFGLIRLLSTSPVEWLRGLVAGVVFIEYPLFFLAAFLFTFGLSRRVGLALILAAVATLGLFFASGGLA